MLVPLGARRATERISSTTSRGTGVDRKFRMEWRVVIAAETLFAGSQVDAFSVIFGSVVNGDLLESP